MQSFNKLFKSFRNAQRIREIIVGNPPTYKGLLRKECMNNISFCIKLSIAITAAISSGGATVSKVIQLIYENPIDSHKIITNVFLEALLVENDENINRYGYSSELYLAINNGCASIFGMDVYQIQDFLKKNNILDVIEYYSSTITQFSENPTSFIGGSFSC